MKPNAPETPRSQIRKKKWIVLTACFILPTALMAAVFAVCAICPFGSRSLGIIDMSHQYIAFLSYCRQLLTGGGDLFYLPGLCLGCSLPAALAYYITSPLNLIFCLFPVDRMLVAVSVVYILRTGLCGLTMGLYVCKKHGTSFKALFAAVAYAFMGYMVAYCFNFLWQDCVILLPILAMGIERLAGLHKPWLYVIVLAACIIMSYYIGYMLCIFSVLWFAYELICEGKKSRPYKLGGTIVMFALASLAAGALSAGILLPQLAAVSGGKAEFSLSVLTLEPKFNLIALISKLYTGAFGYEEIMPQGLPNIFCGMGVMTLAALYFFNRRIPARRRVASGVFLLGMVLSFWIQALDLIWHCLNTPDWFNCRYSFIFNFLLAALAYEELCSFRGGHQLWHYAMPAVLLAAGTAAAFIGRTYSYVTAGTAVECLAGTLVLCALLAGLSAKGCVKRAAALLTAAFIVLSCTELAVNAGLDLKALTAEHSSNAEDYADYTAAKQKALDLLPGTDDSVRVESTAMFDMDRCEALLFGYNGISGYSSTIPKENLDFLKNIGYTWFDNQWALYSSGVTAAADSLLGVRYVLADKGDEPYDVYAKTERYTVYENKNALPLAFTVDGAITNGITADNCFDYLKAVYAAASPKTQADIFLPAQVNSVTTENLDAKQTSDGTVYTAQTDGSACAITWSLTAAADGPLYADWNVDGYPGAMVFVDGKFTTYHLVTQSNGSLYLGDFKTGQTVTVRLEFSVGMTLENAAFCTEDESAVAAYCNDLAKGGCSLTEKSSSHYTGTFTTGEGDTYLLVTMPCDGGWTIKVDGQKVAPVQVLNCLMAVPVTAGAHTVELRYIPAGITAGTAVSALTLCVCVAAYLWMRKKKSARPPEDGLYTH